jgi:nucleoid-associated protein YgaU
MAAVALLLTGLAPSLDETAAALTAPQRTVDTDGADALLLAAAGLAAWCVWTWGALGLALTALSAAPGAAGGTARVLLRAVLPAGARRGAALALGIGLGLGVASPALAGSPTGTAPAPATEARLAVPDWPSAAGTAVPDWPGDDVAEQRVVVAGDCLWDIAADALRRAGPEPGPADVAAAVQAWWSANADVIGPDPDLILPGQVLQPPATP